MKANMSLKFLGKFFVIFVLFFTSKIFANALETGLTETTSVTASTAGVKMSYYEIEWCSPHSDLFDGGSVCEKGYFYKDGSVGIITYEGEFFKNGDVGLSTVQDPTSVTNATRTSNIGLYNFFDVNTLKFQGEGTYTVKILLVDYAYNASIFKFTYRIDKTAPQFILNEINENNNNNNVFVSTLNGEDRLDGLSGSIVKYDSNSLSSDDMDKYFDPDLLDYSGDEPEVRTSHTRRDLFVMYFKDKEGGSSFNLETSYSDTYNDYLTESGNSRELISGVSKFEILDEDGILIQVLSTSPTNTYTTTNQTISLLTSYLTENGENTQEKYKIRLYDNTIGKGGSPANYSEIIFYAVRDNTPPNMGGNNLAGTDKDKAIKMLLKFGDGATTVWDENVAQPTNSSALAKFISADDDEKLYSSLSDVGITGDGQTSGSTTNDKYAWYNAGIPRGGSEGEVKIQIESNSDTDNYSDVFTSDSHYKNRFTNTGKSKTKNFSIVDGDRSNGYRKYTTKFTSSNVDGDYQICDNVGNCLNPYLDFRVVANKLSNEESIISLNTPSKAFANGTDKYKISVEFKDEYGNTIVGVTADGNTGDLVIKKVNSYFDFDNGLYSDQHTEEPNGDKLAIVTDAETDNEETQTGAMNNADSNIFFQENAEGTAGSVDGIYSFELASKVPTAGFYPFLSENTALKLTQIRPKSFSPNTDNVGFYPNDDLDDALGLFDKHSTGIELTGNDNFLTYDNGFLSNDDYKTDLSQNKRDSYGEVTLSDTSPVIFDTLNNRELSLEYASPAIYAGSGFAINHLINNIGQSKEHTKLGYNFDTSEVSNINLYEKYLPSYTNNTTPKYTPKIFNLYSGLNSLADTSFDNSKINSGTTITLSDGYSEIFKTKSSPIDSTYKINGYGFNMGYVSYLTYKVDGNEIKIPSISRNVSDFANNEYGTPDKNSRFYFPETGTPLAGDGNYVILGDPIKSTGLLSAMGIAITGMSNSEDSMIVDKDAGRKANLNIGENLTRYDLMTTLKKNVSLNSAGLDSWCTDVTITNLNSDLSNCTVEIDGEKISFIEGNVDINCSGNCIMDYDLKRTIVVKNGSTYIKSNISTYGKNSQLLIGTITDSGLENVTISTSDNPNLPRNENVNGWTFVDPSVTNIDAFVVSEGPMVSGERTASNIQLFNAPSETQLKNQLHIYGSTLSLNTVGGYKGESGNDVSKCPYIVNNCDQKTAFIFDLVTLRRYSLESESATNSSNFVPSGGGLRSGGLDKDVCTITYDPDSGEIESDSCAIDGSWDLRRITDTDYIVYPLLVERDTSWNKSQSIMFEIGG